MRVLIVNDDLEHRFLSVPRLARQLALFLAAAGDEVALLGTVRRRTDAGEARADGLLTIRVASCYALRFRSWIGLFNPQVLPAFARFARRFQPDVVHFHNVHTHVSFHALRIARRLGARVLLTAHDVMLFWGGKLDCYDAATTRADLEDGRISYRRGWRDAARAERLRWFPPRQRLIRGLVNRSAHQVIAVSDRLREALADNGFTSPVTVHNGLDAAEMDAGDVAVENFRRKYRLSGRQVLLAGGRLSQLKGLQALLQAVARLRRQRLRLLIIGGGTEGFTKAFHRRIGELGLAQVVALTGWLEGDELACAYRSADICVNPSLCFETLSMFNLEAAAAGKPVVSTFFGGASETVVHGETGLLVNPYDIDALTGALAALLGEPSRARALGERGRRHVREHFDATTQMNKVRALYIAD